MQPPETTIATDPSSCGAVRDHQRIQRRQQVLAADRYREVTSVLNDAAGSVPNRRSRLGWAAPDEAVQ